MRANHQAARECAERHAHESPLPALKLLSAAYLEARQALRHCYEKLQPLQPFDDWVKEIGK